MTSRHSKHPDWDEVREKVQDRELYWLRDYSKSYDINQCTDEQGNALLHWAVVCDENTDAIAYLSHFLIDPNIKNASGQTALQLVQDTHPDYLRTLHEYHLCIDFAQATSEPNGLDALFAAIYHGDATLGDTSSVEDDGNEKNAGGWTALQCAAMYDRPHLIRELHQRFPKLDPDCSNLSPLRLAALYGHSNCIIALCECFPAINAGYALQAACRYNRSACIPILRQCFPQLTGNELEGNYSLNSALKDAVSHDNPECIRALHSCFPSIDPNLQGQRGNTALIAAAQHPKNSNCIPVLSECFPNIDSNKQDNNGDTALMHASERGLPQSITLLATYFPSIDVNMRNEEGNTALMLAIERDDDEECIVALCESFPNIDPNIQNWYGQTALMFAVRELNPEPIISQLNKSFPNIDPTIQDKDQDTALMHLLNSFNCSVKSVGFFLDTFPNVDVDLHNAKGETALALAIQKNDASIVALLLERFPDIISFINSTKQTALMLAIKKNNTQLISILLKHIAQIQ